MDSEPATVVVLGITALAVLVWLAGFAFLVSTSRKAQAGTSVCDEGFAESGSPRPNLLTGAAEVDGQPGVLAARAASLLARGTLFPNVPLRIVEKSESHVRFERIDPGGDGQSSARWLRQGQLSFVSLGGGRSRVEWVVELKNIQWLLHLGAVFQVVGLIVIIAGCWALLTFVVPAADPGVRWQSVQMVQAVHFLWPPFLFAALYRRGRRDVAARLQALAHNLPYLDEA